VGAKFSPNSSIQVEWVHNLAKKYRRITKGAAYLLLMNTFFLRCLLLVALASLYVLSSARSQVPPPRRLIHPAGAVTPSPDAPSAPAPTRHISRDAKADSAAQPSKMDGLKFDLEFEGGKLPTFLKAVAKALATVSKEPLNVVVPTEDRDVEIPALSLKQITVRELFAAVGEASRKRIAVPNPNPPNRNPSYSFSDYSYGFLETVPGSNVWLFSVTGLVDMHLIPPQNNSAPCLVYQLRNYLAKGLSVEDITTAIQAAWKVSGIENPPELKFHAETGLLFVAGSQVAIDTITQVLNGLAVLPDKPSEPSTKRPLTGPSSSPAAK
jgi:hypothetical protein